MIALVLLIPLFAAIIAIAVVKNDSWISYIALTGTLASLALLPVVSRGVTELNWFTVGAASIDITVMVTPINLLLIAAVLIIAPLVYAYSIGFMERKIEHRRFFIEMLAFEISMLAFAMSGNMILFFISWEFLSITSYLLIGFWNHREKANRAARKAITIVFIGDICILASIAILWSAYGSLEFNTIFYNVHAVPQAVYYAALFMIIAVATKSAQFPFQEWLPDAMEGPTPVSAFLHSSTMVKAGVFAVIVLFPLFALTNTLGIITVISAFTAVLATLNAMKETHIKRVIAFSTVQELSLMLLAVSAGAMLAGIYFFIAQTFYKALLFFSAGAVMKATGSEDIKGKAHGMSYDRLLVITTLFGVLSLAGFIPFDGFFSNVGLGASLSQNIPVYVFISVIGVLTSFYIFRWFLLASRKSNDPVLRARYAVQPKIMVYTMAILAVLTLAASFVFFNIGSLLRSGAAPAGYLQPYLYGNVPSNATEYLVVSAEALIGAACGYVAYRKRISASQTLSAIMYNSTIFNSAYALVAAFACGIAEGAALFDIYLNMFFDYIGRAVYSSGDVVRRVSTGSINAYALIFAIGLVIVLVMVYLYTPG